MLPIPEHHAVCFVTSSRADFLPMLTDTLIRDGRHHEITEMNVIDIDTARTLKEWNNRSYGMPKTMILSFHTITHQAQNALLKVLEEPSVDTRFILVTSHLHGLLPTVQSRLHVVVQEEKENEMPLALLFLKTKPADRMELPEIEALLEATDKEDRKDREQVQKFLSNLYEISVRARMEISLCKEVAELTLLSSGPSSSGKMILEYLALRLPITVA